MRKRLIIGMSGASGAPLTIELLKQLQQYKEIIETHLIVKKGAEMTLEQCWTPLRATEKAGGTTVRLHTGDPASMGHPGADGRAGRDGIAYDDTPGVSSFCGAAAALNAEYTLPAVSQTVIITRMEGRTPVPEKEKLASLASHGATMVIFLSIGLIDKVQEALLQGAYTASTPAAVVYKAPGRSRKPCAAPLAPWPKAPSRRALPKRP